MLTNRSFRCNNQVYPNLITRQYSDHSKKSGGGSGGILFAVGALALTGGATLAYAKYDSDFRKTLIQYVPFTESLLKESSGNILSEYYNSIKTSLFNLITGKQDTTKSVETLALPKISKSIEKPEVQEYKGKCLCNLSCE